MSTVGAKKSSAGGSVERRTPQSSSSARDGKAAKESAAGDADVEGSDVNEYAGDDVVALSSPPQPVPPPGAGSGAKSGGRSAVRSAVSSVSSRRTPSNNADDTSDVCYMLYATTHATNYILYCVKLHTVSIAIVVCSAVSSVSATRTPSNNDDDTSDLVPSSNVGQGSQCHPIGLSRYVGPSAHAPVTYVTRCIVLRSIRHVLC